MFEHISFSPKLLLVFNWNVLENGEGDSGVN